MASRLRVQEAANTHKQLNTQPWPQTQTGFLRSGRVWESALSNSFDRECWNNRGCHTGLEDHFYFCVPHWCGPALNMSQGKTHLCSGLGCWQREVIWNRDTGPSAIYLRLANKILIQYRLFSEQEETNKTAISPWTWCYELSIWDINKPMFNHISMSITQCK